MDMRAGVNVVDLLSEVRVPTLVIHAREDHVIPLAEGRLLASEIRGAEFVELPSKNHILLENEPAWRRFQDAVLDFFGRAASGDRDDPFTSLSPRERQVLGLITEGLSNTEIGERLTISEKTVRNHVSSIYDKLGVWTRAQAMVFAREHGFH
jgi:DNA-binding NarL/FixJ family response regulator